MDPGTRSGICWSAPERKRLYTDGNPLPGAEVRLAADGATRDGVRTTLAPPSVSRAVADPGLFAEFESTKGGTDAPVHPSQYQADVTTQDLTEQLQFDVLPATEGGPPTVPPQYRLDVYPPGMSDPNLLSWPATGAGVVSIVDRRGEQRASQDLFVAGVGYGAALALAPLGVQFDAMARHCPRGAPAGCDPAPQHTFAAPPSYVAPSS